MGGALAVVVVKVHLVPISKMSAPTSNVLTLASSTAVSANSTRSLRIDFMSLDFKFSLSQIDGLVTWRRVERLMSPST